MFGNRAMKNRSVVNFSDRVPFEKWLFGANETRDPDRVRLHRQKAARERNDNVRTRKPSGFVPQMQIEGGPFEAASGGRYDDIALETEQAPSGPVVGALGGDDEPVLLRKRIADTEGEFRFSGGTDTQVLFPIRGLAELEVEVFLVQERYDFGREVDGEFVPAEIVSD
jgi:hypothetical protein